METVQLESRIVAEISETSDEESDSECELMIQSLQRELSVVRSQLEAVVHQLTDVPISTTGVCSKQNNGFSAPGTEQVTTLIQAGTTRVRPVLRPLAIKKKLPEVSPKDRQHYLSVVDVIEKEQQATKKRCLQLMELHIANQLKRLQSTEKKLSKNLQRRLEKEKAGRMALRPVMTRSTIPESTSDAKYYKSSFYKAASLEYEICKRAAQKRLLKSKPPRIIVTSFSQQDIIEEADDEPSNSWAITATGNDFDKQLVKTKDEQALKPTVSKPPELIPLSAFFRKGSLREAIEAQCHEARVKKLTNTQQCVQHMYKLAKSHQSHMTHYDHDITYDAKLFPSTMLATPPTSHRLSRSSHSPKPSKRQESSLPSLKINSSDIDNDSSSCLLSEPPKDNDQSIPLLSMDEALSSGRTKEARTLSTKWSNYLKNLEMGSNTNHYDASTLRYKFKLRL